MYLVITESPAKAKKIQGFLSDKYVVKSSCGHIRDLEKKKSKRYGNPADFGIDVEDDFKPTYKVMSDKKDVVKLLKENGRDKKIIFAADDDREGEAIAWHTAIVLKSKINENNRIIFREISKKAILKAIENPIQIDMNEVNAQQARRIIDRLIGFKLSPCLWKHIKCQESGLSAGRVQSALLNLLQERETYIKNYETELLLDIKGVFENFKESDFIFTKEYEIDNEFISHLFMIFSKDRTFNVTNTTVKEDKSYSKKPFITSTLQQCAQNELGFPVKMTMDLAQRLYENGHITYIRTDSTFISEDFQRTIHKYIDDKYDDTYYQTPNEKKVKGAQEAHEAIRPTNLYDIPVIDETQMKLYKFILKRTITSHMKPAEYDVYKINLSNKSTECFGNFHTTIRHLTFPGYLIYGKTDIKIDEKPSFQTEYKLLECISSEKEGQKPLLYNESAIVNLLEGSGIGRPSTYASIISTLDNRNYTIKSDIKLDDNKEFIIHLSSDNKITEKSNIIKGKVIKQRIQLTSLGIKVLTYLQEHFSNIIQKQFTCAVEKDLDLIADGKINFIDVIRKVYVSFVTIVDQQMKLQINNTMKQLGVKQGKTIYIGSGKYGPYLQIVNENDSKKNTSIQKYIELIKKDEKDITLDDAIQFLKFPKKINNDIIIHIGPYGYYMKHNGKNHKINQSGKYTEDYCISIIRK
jgi:DNA topoisomerase-1